MQIVLVIPAVTVFKQIGILELHFHINIMFDCLGGGASM